MYCSAVSAVASAPQSSRACADCQKFIALEATIEDKAFHYVYQPIVDSHTHAVLAHQALCCPTPALPGMVMFFHTAERACW